MKNRLSWVVELFYKDLFEGGRSHTLLYGEHKDTLAVLREVYEAASKKDEFLCTFHDASLIEKPMDFFEPILKLKYGEEYKSLSERPFFQEMVREQDMDCMRHFASLCGKEEVKSSQNSTKLPVIFIDGIEELFFKLDFGHLDEEGRNRLLTEGFMEQPLPRGFGNVLRRRLHQTRQGVICGTVRNTEGIEYNTTLGNYSYLFYADNFRQIFVEEK